MSNEPGGSMQPHKDRNQHRPSRRSWRWPPPAASERKHEESVQKLDPNDICVDTPGILSEVESRERVSNTASTHWAKETERIHQKAYDAPSLGTLITSADSCFVQSSQSKTYNQSYRTNDKPGIKSLTTCSGCNQDRRVLSRSIICICGCDD